MQGSQQTTLFAESVEWLSENGDITKPYVLPDGYIYAWMSKAVTILHNANDGNGVINKRPSTSSTVEETPTTTNGLFCTPPIEIDNTWSDCFVTISGIEKIICTLYSQIFVFYYDSDGKQLGSYQGGQLGAYSDHEADIYLPFTFNIVGGKGATYFANAKYIRITMGINTSAISNNDIATLVGNFERLNSIETSYNWFSTGVSYSTDDYSQAISALQADVGQLKGAVESTPSKSGAVWYAIGDSITKGYGVGADNCWVKYVMQYNGYDVNNSMNLGISGLGFAKADPNYGKTVRTVVDENDFSEVDLVTIAVGINDWKEVFSIDTVTSEMGYCFEKILLDNPYCKIIFIAPFNICLKGSVSTNWALGYNGNDVTGGTLQDFIDTQIAVCERYGIQSINMTNASIINNINIETVLYDKIHPDAMCHKALGRELARRITFS